MSTTTRRRAVRATSWALVLTAGLLLPLVEAGATYLTLLGASGSIAAIVAATQVRQDDVLGWLTAVGSAAPIALLVTAAHTDGVPGHRQGGWTVSAAGAVALCSAVIVAAVACGSRPAHPDRDRRVPSAGTLRP